jgi:hypothetical protein
MLPDWKPSFILLEVPLPAKECGDKLLGRVVTDMRNPTNDYKPENPSEYLTSYSLEVWDADWKTFSEHNKKKDVTLAVGKTLGLSGSKSSNATDKRTGDFVRTRRLTQHKDTKKALMVSEHADDVMELLEGNDNVGYLVVGYKSILDGSHSMEYSQQKALNIKGSIPVSEAVQGTTQGAVNLPTNAVNPKGEMEASDSSKNQTLVQYRPITLTSSWFSSGKEAKIGPVARVKFPAAVYGDNDDEAEITEDDEVSGLPQDDDGVIMAEEIVCGSDLVSDSSLFVLT